MGVGQSNPQCSPYAHKVESSWLCFAPCLLLSSELYYSSCHPLSSLLHLTYKTKAVYILSYNHNTICAWIKIWQQIWETVMGSHEQWVDWEILVPWCSNVSLRWAAKPIFRSRSSSSLIPSYCIIDGELTTSWLSVPGLCISAGVIHREICLGEKTKTWPWASDERYSL